jgi:hypothetical protein
VLSAQCRALHLYPGLRSRSSKEQNAPKLDIILPQYLLLRPPPLRAPRSADGVPAPLVAVVLQNPQVAASSTRQRQRQREARGGKRETPRLPLSALYQFRGSRPFEALCRPWMGHHPSWLWSA